MRNEEVCQAEVPLQILEKIHHSCLDGDIQRSDWFVADDEAGVERKGARDADALSLAARKLVWVPSDVSAIESDLREQLGDLKRESLNLRFQRSSGQLEATSEVRAVRRDIARINTILTERRRAAS